MSEIEDKKLKHREYMIKYRENNLEKLKEYHRQWQIENKDKHKKIVQRYIENNYDRYLEQHRIWNRKYRANKKIQNERNKEDE